ncbi:SPARC-like protein 1 isoform X2 [Hoplias malabaricus]|uniref:SPARC-like protein 1 isoform X2 n=1 Tax=Hoplias malabaricus TaxID=27720 RepID=UPI0034635FBB
MLWIKCSGVVEEPLFISQPLHKVLLAAVVSVGSSHCPHLEVSSDLSIVQRSSLQTSAPGMKSQLLCRCLLASALILSVQSKPHGKHQPHHKEMKPPKEKSPVFHEADDSILPTFFPFEASSPEPEDEDVTEKTSNSNRKSEQVELETLGDSDVDEKNPPVLLSEEALTKLLQASEEEQQAVEEDKENEDEREEAEMEEKKEESNTKEGEGAAKELQQVKKEEVGAEELESSTDSEIPMDLDYAADREAVDPLPSKLEEADPHINKAEEEEERLEDELPTAMEDYDPQQSSADLEETKEEAQEEQADQSLVTETPEDEQKEPLQATEHDQTSDEDPEQENQGAQTQDEKNDIEPTDNYLPEEKEAEKDTSENKSSNKSRGRKQKAQRQRKMQSDQPSVTEGPTESESAFNTLQKSKRRKNGKWSPLVGMNPVQIRATVELFPRTRPLIRTRLGADGQEAEADACENFRCKRGKVCKLTEEQKPTCVCQEPAECPPSVAEFEHVCGTDNQTYDTSCQLFATKCSLEGTKKGHRLHLDYTGSCKFIPSCLSTELVQFPLRMRDWLKNVLLQLYEHESVTPGFLTAKQRARVQKLYESERRLHAGDHPIELLAQDFEKNYHMYIYPVHWQFAQMDQHPSDRFLSHSELAPLRVPLVPMEHCTSVFFQECDADKDKLVSFREWCQCFGIKDEDMDSKLLF